MSEATVKMDTSGYERLLSEAEAATFLGLTDRPNSAGALRWLMRTRKIAYVRLARGMYGFRRADLLAFIDASRIPAAGRGNPRKTCTAT
jgi:hypothetical protein